MTVLHAATGQRVPLPKPVARIYEAVAQLKALYPGRSFTPDGHLVGSIGEVIAVETLGLRLCRGSFAGHDAHDGINHVQIKMIGGGSIAMYDTCERLVVLRVISPQEAEIVYDGPAEPAWAAAGKKGKDGQRVVGLSTLKSPSALRTQTEPPPKFFVQKMGSRADWPQRVEGRALALPFQHPGSG